MQFAILIQIENVVYMELVPVIYNFILISGGLLLILLLGSYVISRISKRKTNEMIYGHEVNRKNGEPKSGDELLKEQLLSLKEFSDTNDRNAKLSDTREIIKERKSKLESLSGSKLSAGDRKTVEGKARFSVMNKNTNANKKSQNKLEVENEFRIFYQQNYSNTA